MVFGEERREEKEASSWAWQNQLDGRGRGGGEKVSVKAPKTLFLQAHAASQERRGGKDRISIRYEGNSPNLNPPNLIFLTLF